MPTFFRKRRRASPGWVSAGSGKRGRGMPAVGRSKETRSATEYRMSAHLLALSCADERAWAKTRAGHAAIAACGRRGTEIKSIRLGTTMQNGTKRDIRTRRNGPAAGPLSSSSRRGERKLNTIPSVPNGRKPGNSRTCDPAIGSSSGQASVNKPKARRAESAPTIE